jgi:cell division septum initiation protein DivIVA
MADQAIDPAIHDAETSLDTLLAYLEPLASLRKNLGAMAQAALDEATQKAEQFVAAAKAHAGEIVGAAEGRVAELATALEAAKGEHSRLTAAVAAIEGKHSGLVGKVEAAQAQLDKIEGEIAATLARFAPKA